MKQFISIGQVLKPHGTEGELKVSLSLPSICVPEDLNGKNIFFGNFKKTFKVENLQPHQKNFLLLLEEITTLEQAEEFRDEAIFVDKELLGELPENEFYINDLVGLKVFDVETNEPIGEIKDLNLIPGNTLLQIKLNDEFGKSFLIPFAQDFIHGIDLEKKVIFLKDWKIFAEV